MANIIEQVNVGGVVYNLASTAYAESGQNETTAAKTINLDGFSLVKGVTIHVKFTNANTAANPTLSISGGDTEANTARSIVGITTWPAGTILTLTYDGANWVRDYDETIANNITGSGTSGHLVKFNNTNSITDGPALTDSYDSSTAVTTSHKFLREDGTWAVPKYTTNTDEKVKQTGITTNGNYPILLKNTTGTSDVTAAAVNFGKTTNKVVTVNPSDGSITAPGGLTGNASSATEFSAATTVSLSGDVSGTSNSSKKGWSITTSIGEGKVTNAMLAGSISNDKLANHTITIGNVTKNLGETFALSDLGIAAAMNFKGTTTTSLIDGDTTSPIKINNEDYTPVNGDVVLNSGKEFVWTGTVWEELGDESSWALSSDVLHVSGAKGDIIYWSDVDTPVHLVAGTNGQVLKLAGGVPTWGTDNDTKVTQAYSTNTNNFPLLFSNTAGITSTSSRGATTALVNNSIYVQPSTGTLHATKFSGDGSALTNVTASSVDWSNVDNKKFSALYVNATTAGAANDTAATANDTTYIHLYDNDTKQSTIQLKGAGGTTIASAANSKVITITSTKYKSKGSANALTSLKVKYNDGTAHDDSISNVTATPTSLGTVTNAVLYIKSMYYGTTSVSTGVTTDS